MEWNLASPAVSLNPPSTRSSPSPQITSLVPAQNQCSQSRY